MGRISALAAAALLAAPAAASIPPAGWEGPEWSGPGLLCRPTFTLRLLDGEVAEERFPSVGLIRYTVRSGNGVFEIAEDWMSGRDYEERELLRETSGGKVFSLTGRNDGRAYLYVPENKARPFLLRFDPLSTQPPSFTTGEAERSVLERLSFSRNGQEGCLLDPSAAKERKE